MGKKLIIGVVVIVIILAIGGYFYLTLFPGPEPPARLIINEGSAEVSSDGTTFRAASSGQLLRQGDTVRTGAGSRATIVLFGATTVRLDENTEVKLSDLPASAADKPTASVAGAAHESPGVVFAQGVTTATVQQNRGRTWANVRRASGIESFSARTPRAVATVRGTTMDILVGDEKDWIALFEGSAEVTPEGGSPQAVTGKRMEIFADGTTELVDNVEDDWITQNKLDDQEFLDDGVDALLKKYANLVGILKSQGGLTDEQVRAYAQGYLSGETSVQDAIDQGIIPQQYVGLVPEELKRY